MEEKLSVLIADDNKHFADGLAEYLKTQPDFDVVGCAYNGEEALGMIIETNPDILVLDTIMPKRDGLSVLRRLKEIKLSKTPIVIVVSVADSTWVTESLTKLGAAYFMLKPQDNEAVADVIRAVGEVGIINKRMPITAPQSIQQTKPDLETITTEFMHALGIPAHIKGYQYIRTAIMMAVDDMDILKLVTKQLYPAIAKKHKTTSSRVERAIRHSIEVAWSRGRAQTINEIFGCTLDSEKGKPTNSEFVAMIADKIRLRMK